MAQEARKVVVLGVGNRLRGDDAAGCLVCDELNGAEHHPIPLGESALCPKPATGHDPKSREDSGHVPACPELFVLDCGSTPENYIQPVADKDPVRILVVDCCDYRAKPGEFRLFSRSEIAELSYGLLSTHTLPLALFVEMLTLSTNATVELLGVQPQGIEFGTGLSEPVRRALPALLQFIRDWTRAEAAAH